MSAHWPNEAVTDEGHLTLIHALRHEWEMDDIDDQGRSEILHVALGDSPGEGLLSARGR